MTRRSGALGKFTKRESKRNVHRLNRPLPRQINLPSFGDAMGSQAAYLQYEGKETQAETKLVLCSYNRMLMC